QPHGMPLLRVDAESADLGGGRALACTPLDTAARDQVERGEAFRHPSGMVVGWRHQHDAVTQPHALGALRAGRKKYLRGRRVRILLKQVVLNLPGKVDPEPVGQLHLVQRLLEQSELGALEPWPWQLMLVEYAELHGRF